MTIKVGVIGCSLIGRARVLPALSRVKTLELHRLGSRDLAKAAVFASEFGARKFGSYTDVLDDDEVEAVYISLPPLLQEDWGLRALMAGKHVLSEKPGAQSAAQANKMIGIATLMNKIYLEGYMFQFHPQFLLLKRLIDTGEIGEPSMISCTLSYPRLANFSFRESVELGGGVVNDSLGYCVMAALLIFDKDPLSIECSIYNCPKNNVAERVGLVMNFGEGMIAVSLLGAGLQFHAEIKVIGSKGSLTIQRAFSKSFKEKSSVLSLKGYKIKQTRLSPCDHFVEMWTEFSKAILGENSNSVFWSKNFIRLHSIMDQVRTCSYSSVN